MVFLLKKVFVFNIIINIKFYLGYYLLLCDKLRSNEYDPERVKKLMDIITYGQSYDLIANYCQDKKILEA